MKQTEVKVPNVKMIFKQMSQIHISLTCNTLGDKL